MTKLGVFAPVDLIPPTPEEVEALAAVQEALAKVRAAERASAPRPATCPECGLPADAPLCPRRSERCGYEPWGPE